MSERFAALKASVTSGAGFLPLFFIHIGYRALLQAEYRIIKKIRNRILKNANIVYNYRIEKGSSTPLGKRCHDFQNLEKACQNYPK